MSKRTRRPKPRSSVEQAFLGLALIAIMTALLDGVQVWLSRVEGHPVRPFEMGYLLPIAAMTVAAGAVGGIATLVGCALAAAYFLMPGPGFRVNNASDLAGLGFLIVNGLFMIAAVDTARRNIALRIEATARAGRENLLGRVARMARSAADPASIQLQVLKMVAVSLNADRAYILMRREGLDAATIAAEWHRPELKPLTLADAPLSFDGSLRDAGNHGPSSAIHVPLSFGDPVNTVFGVAVSDLSRNWTTDELALVEVVAAEMTAVVDSARLVLRERNIADSLQQALLPQPHRDIEGLDVATYYKAALAEASIGGDFCDIFPVRGGQWALVVGDVSGKGLKAASQIATVRNMLRSVLYLDPCLSCSLGKLNTMLAEHRLLQGFVTLFACIYDTTDRRLVYVNCGHEPPLLRRSDGRIVEMAPTGAVLGVIEEVTYTEESLKLEAGDMLFVYTDGASDAGPTRSEMLEVNGLKRMLCDQPRHVTSAHIVGSLAAGILTYARGVLKDDVCLMVAMASGMSDQGHQLIG